MVINVGDNVKFKSSSILGHGQKRHGQVGTVTKVHADLPAQGPNPKVDIKFADGGIEPGIGVDQIERA